MRNDNPLCLDSTDESITVPRLYNRVSKRQHLSISSHFNSVQRKPETWQYLQMCLEHTLFLTLMQYFPSVHRCNHLLHVSQWHRYVHVCNHNLLRAQNLSVLPLFLRSLQYIAKVLQFVFCGASFLVITEQRLYRAPFQKILCTQ